MITVVGAAASFYATMMPGSQRIDEGQETNMARYFRYLQNFNTGFMLSLQSNPNDRTTTCQDRTTATNKLIADLADPKQYTGGKIIESEFLEKFQVAAIVGMEQFDDCGINEFLISLDGALNNWSSLAGSVSAVGTQLITGWSKKDTSIYISTTKLSDSWDAVDWEGIGKGGSLMISQILKFEAPEAAIEVTPTKK